MVENIKINNKQTKLVWYFYILSVLKFKKLNFLLYFIFD
jgi:hypothetical protein